MSQATRTSWGLALLGALFYLPFLGGVHLFDWDEINFAEIAREMIVLDEYFRPYINYQPFWEKPPLFIWMQVISMKLFGVGEYAARFPNALCGILTLIILYRMGRRLYDHRFGLIWAITYFGTVLPFLYFKSGIIDPWFNLFIFGGIYLFILFHWRKNGSSLELHRHPYVYLFWGGVIIGLGILTKGPVAFLLAALTFGVYWVYKRFRFYVSVPEFLGFTFSALIVTGAWFGLETLRNGTWFMEQFISYQAELFSSSVAGHKGFPGYHFVVLLIGCFPASIFAIRGLWNSDPADTDHQKDFRRWMIYLMGVVVILFSIVQSKIVHYSSLAYFPLTFLAAQTARRLLDNRIPLGRAMRAGLWAIGGLFMILILALPFAGRQAEQLATLFDDPFAQANLEANVYWSGWEVLPAILLVMVIFLFLRHHNRERRWEGFLTLYIGTGIFVFLTLVCFIKRIEGYSQRAAIEFYEERQDESCYVITHAFKSYAHLFYSRKRPVTDERSYNKEWLLTGPVDRDVYVVSKIHRADELGAYPELVEIGRKNGFVFFHRPPPGTDR